MSTRHGRTPPAFRRRRTVAINAAGVSQSIIAPRAAFTLTESIIVMSIVVVLGALLMPIISRVRHASHSVVCISHLRNLSMAFRLYARDNGNHLPYPAFSGTPWERSLFRYTAPAVFSCPGDNELAPLTNSSYDWRDTGIQNTTMAGRPWEDTMRTDAVMIFDALPSWHFTNQMNVGLLDGSARPMDQQECVNDLATPIRH